MPQPQLLETIRIEHRKIQYLDAHLRRIEASTIAVYGSSRKIGFNKITKTIEKLRSNSRHKLRIVYNDQFYKYTIEPYCIKPVGSLQCVRTSGIDYDNKYENRKSLQALYAQKGLADDILIIDKGLITDSYYCNVAFLGKDSVWYTPLHPLLNGTTRQRLLEEGVIVTQSIAYEQLGNFLAVRLFNAMVDFGEIEFGIDKVLL